jgi:hypothetical protein
MKIQKIKYLLMLMASILATGLQAMVPLPHAWERVPSPKTLCGQVSDAFAPQLRKAIVLAKREAVKEDPYRDKAKALRDMVLDKRNRGELPSIGGVDHAGVKSIDIDVVHRKHLSLEICELKKKFAILKFKEACEAPLFWRSNDTILRRLSGVGLAKALTCIKEGAVGVHCRHEDEKSIIALDRENQNQGIDAKDLLTFHELAHALDECLHKGQSDLDCYHWLKDDVKNYDIQAVSLKEWHADKQAISWLKKYNPDQAKDLVDYYEICKKRGPEHPGVSKGYAPFSVRLAWLRDPNV